MLCWTVVTDMTDKTQDQPCLLPQVEHVGPLMVGLRTAGWHKNGAQPGSRQDDALCIQTDQGVHEQLHETLRRQETLAIQHDAAVSGNVLCSQQACKTGCAGHYSGNLFDTL